MMEVLRMERTAVSYALFRRDQSNVVLHDFAPVKTGRDES